MSDEPEYLSPDDFGAMTRGDYAVKAATESFQYLMNRMFIRLKLRPGIDFIEPDGRITRGSREDNNHDQG